jgi:hypothetical protein
VPFHFSPRYRGDEAALRDEVDAWHTARPQALSQT